MATLKNVSIDDTGYLRIPSGDFTERPGDPVVGMIRFNSIFNEVELFNGTDWEIISMTSSRIVQVKTAMSGPARQTISSTTPIEINGLSIEITPKYIDSIMIIDAQIISSATYVSSFGVYRDGFKTANTAGYENDSIDNMQITTFYGDSSATRLRPTPLLYSQVSGTLSKITYSIRAAAAWYGTASTLYINDRAGEDMASFSHMTIMEVKV